MSERELPKLEGEERKKHRARVARLKRLTELREEMEKDGGNLTELGKRFSDLHHAWSEARADGLDTVDELYDKLVDATVEAVRQEGGREAIMTEINRLFFNHRIMHSTEQRDFYQKMVRKMAQKNSN